MITLSVGASCGLAYIFGQSAGGWVVALILILALMGLTFWSLSGWDADEGERKEVKPVSEGATDTGYGEQRVLGLIILFSLAIHGYISGGLGTVFLLPVAFLSGVMFAGGRIPFLQYPDDAEQEGRDVLERIEGADVERIWKIALEGRKIEAIKELRAINHDGLKEAKNAVELLLKSGKNWRSME